MRPHRTVHHRVAAWLALTAVLALALLPSVSRALAFARGDAAWLAVCTTQGMRLADAARAAGGESGVIDPNGHLEACAMCALASGAAPLPVQAALPAALPAATAVRPLALPSQPPRLQAWVRAQPRAPPAPAFS